MSYVLFWRMVLLKQKRWLPFIMLMLVVCMLRFKDNTKNAKKFILKSISWSRGSQLPFITRWLATHSGGQSLYRHLKTEPIAFDYGINSVCRVDFPFLVIYFINLFKLSWSLHPSLSSFLQRTEHINHALFWCKILTVFLLDFLKLWVPTTQHDVVRDRIWGGSKWSSVWRLRSLSHLPEESGKPQRLVVGSGVAQCRRGA